MFNYRLSFRRKSKSGTVLLPPDGCSLKFWHGRTARKSLLNKYHAARWSVGGESRDTGTHSHWHPQDDHYAGARQATLRLWGAPINGSPMCMSIKRLFSAKTPTERLFEWRVEIVESVEWSFSWKSHFSRRYRHIGRRLNAIPLNGVCMFQMYYQSQKYRSLPFL